MYSFTVTYTVSEDDREAVAAALRAMTTHSRAEPGVIDYRAHVLATDPGTSSSTRPWSLADHSGRNRQLGSRG